MRELACKIIRYVEEDCRKKERDDQEEQLQQ